MIQVIYGKKGSGKTKRLLDMANDALKVEHGDIVFVDDDKRYMYDLRHEIRFVDASEYSVKSADMFLGFLSGMLSQNFDVTSQRRRIFWAILCSKLDTLAEKAQPALCNFA